MYWIPIGLAAGLVLVLLRYRRVQAASPPGGIEYWVYLPTEVAPSQNQILEHLFRSAQLPPSEGLLFSDIRLHLGVAARAKNDHLFYRQVVEELAPLTPAQLDAFAGSAAIFKARYICEPPAKDERYLRLLPRVALAAAELSGASIVYDLYQRRMFDAAELAALIAGGDPARAEVHLSVRWDGTSSPTAATAGLRKKRLPELVTEPMEPDERALVTHLLFETARTAWEAGALQPETETEFCGVSYRMAATETKPPGAQVLVHLYR